MEITKIEIIHILIKPRDICGKHNFHEDDLVLYKGDIYMIKEIEQNYEGITLTVVPHLRGIDIYRITSDCDAMIKLYDHTK